MELSGAKSTQRGEVTTILTCDKIAKWERRGNISGSPKSFKELAWEFREGLFAPSQQLTGYVLGGFDLHTSDDLNPVYYSFGAEFTCFF